MALKLTSVLGPAYRAEGRPATSAYRGLAARPVGASGPLWFKRRQAFWCGFGVVAALSLTVFVIVVEQLVTGNLKWGEKLAAHAHAVTGIGLPAAPPAPLAPSPLLPDQARVLLVPPDPPRPSPPPPPPPPDGTHFEQRHLDAMVVALDATIEPDFANGNQVDPPLKHAYGSIGNAFSGSELVLGRGERARGVGAQGSDYVRWSAFTQVVATVMFAKAIEEGILDYEDEVHKYMPSYTPDSLRVLLHDPVTGLPNGTGPVVVATTLRHLLTMRSGHTYLIWRQGQYMIPGMFGDAAVDEEFLWNSYPDLAAAQHAGVVQTGACPHSDSAVQSVIDMPLVHAPGAEPRLGNGYALAGAMLAAALRQQGHQAQSAGAYMRLRVLDPLGMSDTWLARKEPPPADVGSRLAEAFIMRMLPPQMATEGFMDPAPLNGVPEDYVFGASTGYLQPTWITDVRNDSYYCLIQGSFEAQPDPQADSTFGSSGVEVALTGTLADLGKFLRMLLREGVADDGTRLISAQSLHFLKNPTTTPPVEELRYFQGGGEFGITLPEDHSFALLGGVPLLADRLKYPMSHQTYTYTSFYGLTMYYDFQTGNYATLATSVPSTADALWSTLEKRKRTRQLFAVAAVA